MGKTRKKTNLSRQIWLVVAVLIGLVFLFAFLIKGNDVILMNPKGLIASQQHDLLITATLLLLEIGIPTMVIFYFVAWKFRESNKNNSFDPEATSSKTTVFFIWFIPMITAVFLAILLLPATHKLEPKKPIEAVTEPINIKVVALRWKWLFIYPEQNIATVNHLQVPIGTPLEIDLTADETPMSSFWVPHLGGQLYAMTGHVNRINLLASEAGQYQGSTAEINGKGFAGMRFMTHATSREDFDAWVDEVRQNGGELDSTEYAKLLEPSQNTPVTFFGQTETDLYDNMLNKYADSHQHNSNKSSESHGGHQ